jgi:hypothetical protein
LVVPSAILGAVGVTAIETSVAWVTVNVVDPDMFVAGPVAFIMAEPAATDETNPLELSALLIAATVVDDESQVTDAVMF